MICCRSLRWEGEITKNQEPESEVFPLKSPLTIKILAVSPEDFADVDIGHKVVVRNALLRFLKSLGYGLG